MATCMELYIDTLGGLDLDGSTNKNLAYFVVENLATLPTVDRTLFDRCRRVVPSRRCRLCRSLTRSLHLINSALGSLMTDRPDGR